MTNPAGNGRPWRRRLFVVWLASTFLLANAVSVAFLIAMADRHRLRVDATATGEHRLAEQTVRMLKAIEPGAGYELVVAADLERVDPRAWQALLDVGAELESQGPMTLTALEGASAHQGLDALARRLTEREADEIQAQVQVLTRVAIELERAAQQIDEVVVNSLTAAAEAASDEQIRRVMAGRAQAGPRLADDLREIAGRVYAELAQPIMPGVSVPAVDRARVAVLAPTQDAAAQLGLLTDEARAIAQGRSFPEPVRRAAIELSQAAGPVRDQIAGIAAQTERLEPLDVVRVLRALGGAAAAVLVGPNNAVAIDAQTLLPPPGVLRPEAATAPSLRRRVEALVSTAMLTAIDPRRPIVVVAHAEEARFIERPGAMGAAIGHLRRQGIDVLEWPIMLERDPPGLIDIDPARTRPVIHLVLNTNTSVRSADQLAPRPDERAAERGALIARLVDAGDPVLVNMTPSEIVVAGGLDATAVPLAAFGFRANSGAALLTTPPSGEVVEHDTLVRGGTGEHPLQGAMTGLMAYVPWAVAIEHDGSGEAWPLLTVEDERAWAETRWSGYRRVPRDQRAMVRNPPERDPDVDDTTGPWIVAWAGQRDVAEEIGRVVVVGSNDWLADDILNAGQSIDGRMAASYPGNLALLDASLLWLSGRDAFIAPTVSSSSVAVIGQIDDRTLSALRWSLVLGVPAGILLVGGVWRVVRG